jgi:penicillin amidase
MMRRAAFTLAVLAAAWVLPAAQSEDLAGLRARAREALAPIEGEIALDGLQAPVEVLRDRWGVPHIYASTLEDLFFAQGFVAAQDRLWQLDLWRRVAEGRLAEILGPGAVPRDTFARLLRYRGDMTAEWASYAPDAKRIVEAFVRGINAQIAWVEARPERLPIEFQLAGTRPERWTPDVVISRMAGYVMTRNVRSEVQRARLARAVGVARIAEFMPPDPPVPITLPDGLDLADIGPEVLALAEAADAPLSFAAPPSPPAAAAGAIFGVAPVLAWTRPGGTRPALPGGPDQGRPADILAALAEAYATDGSNNWVVAPARTATGRPLLANDPHRALQLPSLRYTVHLNGPGWNVIGAGEPALPGVAAGHNDRIGFGFTIVGTDQQDLYVEQLDPANPDRYRVGSGWETMRVEREVLRVAGEPPRTVELRFTRHGPVIHVDRQRHRAYALRWVGTEPGTAGYLASLSLDTAQSWPEFLAALERWKVPSENLVYADVDGNIGWVAAGLTPIRRNWTGLLPVPGHEGRYEWDGFLTVADLPQSFNPASGFIATANHNILPPGYRHQISYEWGAPHRYQRIVEAIGQRRDFTREAFERLQHDEVSLPARAIVDALQVAAAVAPPATPVRAQAVRMLTAWDGELHRDSAPAALYALWLPHLQRAFAEAVVAPADRPHAPERLPLERLLAILRRPSQAQLALLTGPALEAAWSEAEAKMGPPGNWAWGRLHHARFEHPLATTPPREALLNLPPVPRGGDATTVNNTGSGLRQTSGASFREVIDVGNWDDSSTINVPGQSGQPESPHYSNLLPLWAEGRYHPMLFSRQAVERHLAGRLRLVPKGMTAAGSAAPAATAGGAPDPGADEGGPPILPPFAGRIVNYDRRAGRVAACTIDPAGSARTVGARTIPNTYVWVIEQEVVRQLGSTTGLCDPAWSPDGTRLAVAAPNGLWTYSPTLEDPVLLAETHLPREPKHPHDYTAFARPRWSPDGRYIAFLVTDGRETWLEVVEARQGARVARSDPGVDDFTWVDSQTIRAGDRTIRVPSRPAPRPGR